MNVDTSKLESAYRWCQSEDKLCLDYVEQWIALFFLSFKEARDMLANDEVLAPVYYILGGTKSGEVTLHLI